jgi:hypothetical protein
MKDFKASPQLCAYLAKTIKSTIGLPIDDERLNIEAQTHISDSLGFVMSQYCKHLQYESPKSTVFMSAEGFSDKITELLLDIIMYVTPEDDTEFMEKLHKELRVYLSSKSNPVLEGKWGHINFENGTLTAHTVPRQKRNLDSIFKNTP